MRISSRRATNALVLTVALTLASLRAESIGPGFSRVAEAEVSRALSSKPKNDSVVFRNRLGERLMAEWVSDGKIPGAVLFHDDFASGSFLRNWIDDYAQKGMIKVVADNRGGKCLFIPSRSNDFNCVGLRMDRLVAVDPSRPTAVLWEARQPRSHTPYVKFHFYDADRKDIGGEYQFRSNVDPTQPTLFCRNAHLVSAKMPAKTRYMRIVFLHCPKQTDEAPGEIAEVRVVDLSSEVGKMMMATDAVVGERKTAGDTDVLVYCDDNLTRSYPVLPLSPFVPGRPGDVLSLRECRGEKTRATVVLWSKCAYPGVTVAFSDLKSARGGTIGASALSAKVVKVHYQAEGAPNGFIALSDRQVLVPELLLNDDSLVVADHDRSRNLVKFRRGGSSWYVDINSRHDIPWNCDIPTEKMPIFDAATLQPFDLVAGENKQIALRVEVPAEAKIGKYTGEIAFFSRGRRIAGLPIAVEVLPFDLPSAAETVYDSGREFTMGLYVWATPSGGDESYISPAVRSRVQCLSEWKTLVDNGVKHPAFIWGNRVVFNDSRFREYLALAREAGFPGKTLYLGASGHIGNDTDPARLAAKQVQLVQAMKVAEEFGFEEVYFYGFDEAQGALLVSQIPAWKAAREVGAKVMVSGYTSHYKLVGDCLDLCIYAGEAWSARPSDWHGNGARIWKYNTPQAGPEDPNIFRRNYGLDIWFRGYDGACTYCDIGASTVWNDICGVQRMKAEGRSGSCYRGLCVVYPTADGVIETLALTGLESAIKDVRIMTKFRQALRAKPCPEAQAWFDGIDFASADLVEVRRQAVDWILKSQSL
jgi:hypothetical protein